jgi:predicted DNA-binding transcriptional regulator AlpA
MGDVDGRVLASNGTVAPPPADGEQLLDAAEVARMLGRAKSWVEHHLDDLPPRKSLLGAPVWRKRDVEAWIKNLPKYGEDT